MKRLALPALFACLLPPTLALALDTTTRPISFVQASSPVNAPLAGTNALRSTFAIDLARCAALRATGQASTAGGVGPVVAMLAR